MQITDTEYRYGLVTRFLHWVTAGLLLSLVILGWVSDDLPKAGRASLMDWHIALGVGFMGFAILRMLWRFCQGWPAIGERDPSVAQRVSRWVHTALLGLMILIPLSGWVIVSAAGHDASFFGVFFLPDIMPESHMLEEGAEEAHEFLVNVMLFLAGLHVLAALKHHFVDRDEVMQRMAG